MIATRTSESPDVSRARRVAEALGILLMLSGIDLLFTIWASASKQFYELNPVARPMLTGLGVAGLVVVKGTFMGIGAVIFWRLRRFASAEAAVWGLVLVHVLLIGQWLQYTAILAGLIS